MFEFQKNSKCVISEYDVPYCVTAYNHNFDE